MARTWIDLEAEALAAAIRLSGEKTEQDTVNTVLREYVVRHSRRADPEHAPKMTERS